MLAAMTAWSIFAVLTYAISPPSETDDLPLGRLLLIHLIIGISSGSIHGLLRPYFRSFSGEAVIGALAAVPYSFIAVLYSRQWTLSAFQALDWWAVVLIACLAGPFAIALMHAKPRNHSRASDA
jgi:hypothetical protein